MSRKDIRFDFIKEELWKKLPKDISSKLRSYRGYYGNYVKEENKIKELEVEIKKSREKMEKYRIKMHTKNKKLDYLRNQFTFWNSVVVSQEKGKHKYYNVCVSRSQNDTKSCYLGSETKIQKHLKEFYKKDKDKLKKIEKDWHRELVWDCKVGIVWDRIMDLIIELNEGFNSTTINLEMLYPMKQKK